MLETDRAGTTEEQLVRYSGYVYAAVSLISEDIAASPYTMSRGGKAIPIEDIDRVARAFWEPMPGLMWASFLEITQAHLDLTGEAYWLALTAGGTGEGPAIGFQVIPPHWIVDRHYHPVTGAVSEWKIQAPGAKSAGRWHPAEDVHQIRYPHPERPLTEGMSPVQAFAWAADSDRYARAYTGTVLEHNGQIPGYLSTDKVVNDDKVAELISQKWHDRTGGGMGAKLGPPLIHSGAKFTPLGMTIKDMEFAVLAQMSMEQVFACYHIPPSIAGIALSGGTLEITREARNTYSRNCKQPRQKRIEGAVNGWMLPRARISGYVFAFDSPILPDLEAIHTRSLQDLLSGSITVDEHRADTGRPEIDDGSGAVYFIPAGVRVVEKLEPHDPFASSMFPDDDGRGAIGAGRGLDIKVIDAATVPAQSVADQFREAMQLAARATSDPVRSDNVSSLSPEQHLLTASLFAAAQDKLEKGLGGQSRALFGKEQKAILAALGKLDRMAPPAEVRAAGDLLLDSALATTEKAWEKAVNDSVLKSLNVGWDLLAGDGVASGFTLAWDIYSEEAALWARENAGLKVVDIQEATREILSPIISEGIEQGSTIEELKKAIGEKIDEYKGYRAERIARTETSGAVNKGKYDHAFASESEFSIRYKKTWNPVRGERTRPHHRASAIQPSQTIPLRHKWSVKGQPMDRPLDPNGSADNVIHCRCTMTMEVVES